MGDQELQQEPIRRKKDSAKLVWDTKPRRAPNPKDIEFQTAEIVIPNPHRDKQTLTRFDLDLTKYEIDKTKANRLIWGDNLLAMQALLAQGYEGKINLIYIDPPFWTGENYYANFVVEGNEITKSPSFVERLAYKDIWAGGIDSFLDMLFPRLQLMKRLLADNGSIYVHCDWHIGHYIKVMMDEIFGYENFRNEIVWNKGFRGTESKNIYQHAHDIILWYSKTDRYIWNQLGQPYRDEDLKRYNKIDEEGRRYALIKRRRTDGTIYYGRTYPKEEGKRVDDVINHIAVMASTAKERIGFDTQKPEELIKIFILASSNPGSIVADFFCGSGTTLAVAEKLNRHWIGTDFSKVAIQITRNRLVNIDAKPFLIENIGNYQRHMIYLYGGRIYEMQKIVLKLYGATPRNDYSDLGMKKGEDGVDELVYVGYPDRAITAKKTEEITTLAKTLDGRGYKRVIILGWDYEYNYEQFLERRKRANEKWDIEVVNKTIPPEVYEYLKKANEEDEIEPFKEKIFFHEKPYLKLLTPIIESTSSGKAKVTVGIDRYVLFDIPIEKEEDKIKIQEIARNNFAALIDYWAVDWDYDGMTFKSTWQAFRGFGKRAKTVPIKTFTELESGKKYTIAIRVVDIFGNDAAATLTVDLKGR